MIERCAHPFRGLAGAGGYWDFDVPMLPADYVTDDAGTGFVHTAPGHGADDYNTYVKHKAVFDACGTKEVPHTVAPDSSYFPDVPVFAGERIYDDKGKDAGANEAVIAKLVESGALVARGRLKHQYPHSWRSKAPLIFRNTPQWFIAMDKPIAGRNASLRQIALEAIRTVEWVPRSGETRITGMIENRPDWVVSRQRAWGVPIAVFVAKGANAILKDERVNAAIAEAFESEGADAWYKDDGRRFLVPFGYDPAAFDKVGDILDVWFDSGSTHAFALEQRDDLKVTRKVDGGPDQVMYLEGTDQHRGWFHSSLLESCGTRGRAPYDIVLTHGFVLDEKGQKMSKSVGNVVAPQSVIKESGADILRLWVAASDYSDDLRIGPEILKTFVETYRKLRNTIRWMLGSLAHFDAADAVEPRDMPELERFILHRLAELDGEMREAYAAFDYKRVIALLNAFMTSDLSAFYFDVRKDALYCDPLTSHVRRSALTVIDRTFACVAAWLAPILAFTAEEAWLARYPEALSVHLETFPAVPGGVARRGPWRALGQGAPGPPRGDGRPGDRACAEADRREPGGRASRLHRGCRPRRGGPGARHGRDLHHLGDHGRTRRGARRGVPARRREGRRRGAGPGAGAEMRPLLEGPAGGGHRPGLPGRDPAGCRGAPGMGFPAGRRGMSQANGSKPPAGERRRPSARVSEAAGGMPRDTGPGAPEAAARPGPARRGRSLLAGGLPGGVEAPDESAAEEPAEGSGARPPGPDRPRRGAPDPGPRPGDEALHVLRLRPAGEGAGRPRPLRQPHRGLEPGHLLRALPAEHGGRTLDPRPRVGRRVDRPDLLDHPHRGKVLAASLGLIVGGAVGNVIDRLVFGAVFDFIQLHAGSFSWYVFNVADAAIVAGVIGLLYDSFFLEKRRAR